MGKKACYHHFFFFCFVSTMFSDLLRIGSVILATFNLSANAFNLDACHILSFDKHLLDIIKPFTTQSRLSTTLRVKTLENNVEKGENAGNQHFLLFPQCFLPYQREIPPVQLNLNYNLNYHLQKFQFGQVYVFVVRYRIKTKCYQNVNVTYRM